MAKNTIRAQRKNKKEMILMVTRCTCSAAVHHDY
jgi:hypothetical protein